MENPGGVCGALPATCRARPLRSTASASQAIDHPQETILAKWAQHPGVWGGALMENMGGVCGVLPKTWRVHPLRCVARTTQTIDHHKETIFTKWAQHPRVGELVENLRGVCGWGWGLLENTEGDMRCAFLNFYPNLHLICYPRRGMIKDRLWFQLVPKFIRTDILSLYKTVCPPGCNITLHYLYRFS